MKKRRSKEIKKQRVFDDQIMHNTEQNAWLGGV